MSKMVMIRDLTDTFGDTNKHVHYVHQVEVENIEGLINEMSEALEAEGIAKPRAYEVVEVETVRKVYVEREVQQKAIVKVKGDPDA